jgi:hypothetical protein
VFKVNKRIKPIRSISWWEPRWSFIPRMKNELRVLLSPRTWLRIACLTMIVVAVIIVATDALVPNLQFDWAGALLKSVGVLLLQLTLISGVLFLVPPRITVNRRAIVVQHGNSTRSFAQGKVDGLNLSLHDGGQLRLWVTCRGRSRCYGLPRSVDIAALRAILGEELVVHDYRDDFNKSVEFNFRPASSAAPHEFWRGGGLLDTDGAFHSVFARRLL